MATGRTSKDGAWSGPCSVIVVPQREHEGNLALDGLLAGRLARPRAARYSSRTRPAAVVKLVYTQASGACGLYARGGSSPLSRTPCARCYAGPSGFLPLSSRGLGRRPLTAETGVRIPVAVPTNAPQLRGFRVPWGRFRQ